ncbi:TetR/AcrR family transcriptional regulator [Streptomyces sp. NPDC057575]|uniref:TetR/AcrR family transcriptional regulator n=1 Tax=unclassified Streptomyces TaxID=2593676 RepID=UPI0036BC5985
MTPSPAPDTPPRPQRVDARRNGERLLATARDAFAEFGTAAPLEEIARRAGVGIGTLYRHFPTRQALLQAVLHDRLEALHSKAVLLLDNPAPADALLDRLRSVALHATRYRGLAAPNTPANRALSGLSGTSSKTVFASTAQATRAGAAAAGARLPASAASSARETASSPGSRSIARCRERVPIGAGAASCRQGTV